MVPYYGDFAEDDTVLIPFNTFSSDDPSASVTVTTLIASDIYVHKDGSTTDLVTDGATIAVDFDSITGNHLITIDTSAHADYTTGSEYSVRIEGATVDGGNINAWIGAFSIERAGGALAVAKLIQTAVITNAAGADVSADIATAQADLDTITGAAGVIIDDSAANDTTISDAVWDEAQSGHVGAGTFGIIATEIADILTDTADIQPNYATSAAQTTAQNDLDTITGSDGATLATAQALYAPAKAGDAMALSAGAITNASLAGNMEIVFETDFATNYNQTDNAWVTNGTSFVGTGWNTGKTGYSVSSTGLDAVLEDSTFLTALENQVWDATLTGASHNDANSAGRRLRQVDAAFVVAEGTADGGGANTIDLETGTASTTDDIYNGDRVLITAGTGVGEHGIIIDYDGVTNQRATMAENWVITPDATSEYILVPADCDVESWQHIVVSNGATSGLPAVDAQAISDNTTAADNVQANIGNLDAAVSAVETDTQDLQTQIGTAGAGLTAVVWNASWDAQVQSEVQDALNATFTFTKAGELDVNTLSINGATVVGDGNATPWDGA